MGDDLATIGGIALVLGVIGLVIRSAVRGAPKKASPPPPAGPGKFKVDGVDKATGMDTTWYCQANSEANARVKADLQGIVPTAVQRA